MILDLTIENLKNSGCNDKEATDLFADTESYTTNSSGTTLHFYVCRTENKFYTGADFFRKTYLFNGSLKFPLHAPSLIAEYFELAKVAYLEQQQNDLGTFFNSEIIFDEFINIEISKTFENIKNWNEHKEKIKNFPSIKNNPYSNNTVKQIRIFENYIKFLELQKNIPQQPEAVNPDEDVNKVFELKENNFDDVTPKKVIEHFKILHENGYISKENFELFIKTRFEDNKNLIEKIELLKENSRVQFKSIFYKYYDNVINQKYGKKPQYVKLLCENFTGFEYDAISTNFSD